MDIPESGSDISSIVQAGVLLLARTWLVQLGLPCPRVEEILTATGAKRSRAYELRDRIAQLLRGVVRRPGRPRAAPPPPPTTDCPAVIARETLRFVMDHPGCVHGGSKRRRYADAFRHRVLDLRQQHPEVDLVTFAEAVSVPVGTVEDWLRAGGTHPSEILTAQASPPDIEADRVEADRVEADTVDSKIPIIETVLTAWREWKGGFSNFCTHLRHHQRLDLSRALIAQILFEQGERTPKRRGRRNSDEDALRDSFETFFPAAQWVGDGKQVVVILDGEPLTYNFELMVDASSGAFTGVSVRDEEDSIAVVEAFEHGIETTGDSPIAVLLDNRPSNHTESVDEALGDTLRIRATTERAQNKAHVEGAFGLFAQQVPPLFLRTDDRRELGKQIVALVTEVFARAMNHRPRSDRGGKSRVELYNDRLSVTDEQREEARRALYERLRKQERARQTREARLDLGVRRTLDQAFDRLGLLDPERHFRNAIAVYPVDDIVDGIAIFEGKRNRATLPDGVDARYLLGIVKNVHHVHEADSITDALIRNRIETRDALLDPLFRQRDVFLADEEGTALRSFIDHALAADRDLDRRFWIHAAADFIGDQPVDEQQGLYRDAARRIHATFAIPKRHRSEAERSLVRLLWPLS